MERIKKLWRLQDRWQRRSRELTRIEFVNSQLVAVATDQAAYLRAVVRFGQFYDLLHAELRALSEAVPASAG